MKRLLLDADGVITDWGRAALRSLHGSYDLPEYMENVLKNYGMHTPQFEELYGGRDNMVTFITNSGLDFWRSVEPFEWGLELLNRVIDFAKNNEFKLAIVTSPAQWTNAATPKMEQFKEWCPDIPVVITHNKEFLAHEHALLIDDGIHNIEAFEAAGGLGLLIDNPYRVSIKVNEIIDRLYDMLVWFD